MDIIRKQTTIGILAILMIALSAMIILPTVHAANYTRKTTAYVSVAPSVLGLGQTATVNIWVFPPPAGPNYAGGVALQDFENLTITFTRPDGSKDTFMPTDGSGHGLKPGETEPIGAIWFLYKPNQIGTWTAQFSYPGKTFDDLPSTNDTATYLPATSQVATFTVQKDPVNAGLLNGWPYAALPTGYWTRPIHSDNREWYQISGDWLQARADAAKTCFNEYTTAPNSAHVLWKTQVSISGIIGGAWGSLSYPAAGGVGGGGGSPSIIVTGRVYINRPGALFDCFDLRTGELLYEKAGTVSLAQHLRAATHDPTRNTPETEAADITPYLWETSASGWKLYDPWSGTTLQTITNVLSSTSVAAMFDGDPVIYCRRQIGWNTTIPNRLATNELIKWDYSKVTGNNWTTGIVWRTNLKQADGTGPGEGGRASGISISLDGKVGVVRSAGEDKYYGYNLETGAQIYVKSTGYPSQSSNGWLTVGNGAWLGWDSADRIVHAYDITTGNELWQSQIGAYPWGSQISVGFSIPQAYGFFYLNSYDGYFYGIDATTGKVKWTYFMGNTSETIFGSWPPQRDCIVAGGNVYFGSSEHSPTQPRFRFNKLTCLDARTGQFKWQVSGAIGPQAIADGYLLASSESDGLEYCFGKGLTTTTVTVQNDVIAKGGTVLIKGTVLDNSPAQPGTPAISDANMGAWMDYLHMQKPLPSNLTGVPVKLTAIKADGNSVDLGTVTSDKGGLFSQLWTPPETGKFTIVATFDGSQSYWSSYGETAIGVVSAAAASVSPTLTPAPSQPTVAPTSTPSQTTAPTTSPSASTSASPTVAPPPSSEEPSTTLYIVIAGIAASVIVIAAVALILRRKK